MVELIHITQRTNIGKVLLKHLCCVCVCVCVCVCAHLFSTSTQVEKRRTHTYTHTHTHTHTHKRSSESIGQVFSDIVLQVNMGIGVE